MKYETAAPASQAPAPDPLERAAHLREDLESLRAVSALMSSSLVDESVRRAFEENLARAELDVDAAERQGREEYRTRSAAVSASLERWVGSMLLSSTGLSWESFGMGAWEAFLVERSGELRSLLSAPSRSLADAEASLGIVPTAAGAPAAAAPGTPAAKLVADCDFVSPETVSQCAAAGISTLGDAAGFTRAELSDLGLTQGAVIQLSALLDSAGLSLAGSGEVVR